MPVRFMLVPLPALAMPGEALYARRRAGGAIVAEKVEVCTDRVRQSLVGQPAEQGHAVQQLAGLLAVCTLHARQV